jgi:acyl-CoA thioesterase
VFLRSLATFGKLEVELVSMPVNHGAYTSQSNAQFDIWLKNQHPLSGIRHFETIVALAIESDIHLLEDVEMPSNNRLLIFQKA